MISSIDQKFSFGKFQGVSVARVYTGSFRFETDDLEVLENYLSFKYSSNNQIKNIKSVNLINQHSLRQLINGPNVFVYDDESKVEENFQKLTFKLVSQKSYFEWCVKEVAGFYFTDTVLNHLESLFTYETSRIHIHNIIELDGALKIQFGESVYQKQKKIWSKDFRELNKIKRLGSTNS